jgi:hypothetical protein
MIVLGVDPGLTGAFAWITPDGYAGVADLPTKPSRSTKHKNRDGLDYDLPALLERVEEEVGDYTGGQTVLGLEWVHPVPHTMRQRGTGEIRFRAGVMGNFQLGRSRMLWDAWQPRPYSLRWTVSSPA